MATTTSSHAVDGPTGVAPARWTAVGSAVHGSDASGPTGGATDGSLHGREAECAALRRLLDSARDHRSAVLVIHGEPGVGKSALLADAVSQATDMTVLWASGVEAELGLVYAGLHQLVHPVVDRVSQLPDPQGRALRTALGLDSGRHDRFLVSVALLSLAASVAEDAPLLLVVDDLHWLDRASVSALAFVARRLHAESVAVLCATRDGESVRGFGRSDGLAHLRLRGLRPEAAALVLDGSLPAGAPLHVRQRLLTLADGNPLALQELPRALSPAQLSGHATVPDPVPVSSAIEDAFLYRMHGLSRATRTLVLIAAAERFGDVDLVLRAGRALDCGAAALAEAEATGLLSVDAMQLRFRHPLVRSAVYRSASRSERQAAHQALAQALGGAADRDRRTWHRAAAVIGRDEGVAVALEQSADRAMRRTGHATAAAILELAADLTPEPVDVGRRLVTAATAAWTAGQVERVRTLLERAAPLTGDALVTADIELLRAQCERVVGISGSTVDTLIAGADRVAELDRRRALTMATVAGTVAWERNDPAQLERAADRVADLLSDAATGDTAGAHALLASARVVQGDLAAATRAAARAIATAEQLDAADQLSMAGAAALWIGDDETSLRTLGRAVARARAEGAVSLLVTMLAGQALAEAWTSRIRSARAHVNEGLTLSRQIGHSGSRALYEALLAWIAAVSGDHDECERLAVPATRRGLEQESAPATAIAAWARGLGALGAGRPHQAHGHLRELVLRDTRASHPVVAMAATGDVVEAAVLADDPDVAHSAMTTLEHFAHGTRQPWACAVAARCRALTATTDAVEDHFVTALDHHVAGSRPFEHGRSLLAYGAWLRRRHRRIDARLRLRASLRIFERLGATAWEDRARRELRASGETTRRAGSADFGTLTPQEVQVLQSVRTGATNKQIAAQLYLSPRTIDYHLRKVFVKLGVSSRAELMALASEELDHERR